MKPLSLLILAVACALPAGLAGAASIGVEGFGGVSIPIVQDDTDQGTQFGARIPVQVLPLLTLEPFFASSQMGDKSITIGPATEERDGGDVTAYGLNARIGGFGGPGLSFFPYAGIGSYSLSREGVPDLTRVGYNFGLGLGFSPAPRFGVGVRGEFTMITLEDNKGSRKYAHVTLGASYNVLSLP